MKLTVCLITYNQEKYIAQCIESILMQKASFDWDIVIADDCSTDKTREIISEYKEKFPQKINLLFQEKNVGPAQNFIDLLNYPNSEYIAYIEGDDFWKDPLKLQKQVDVLHENPDCILSFTDYLELLGTDTREPIKQFKKKGKIDFTDLLEQNCIATLTIVFRNQDFKKLPSWYKNVAYGDWFLYLWLLKNGDKACHLPQKTAIYRREDGVYNKLMKNYSATYENTLKAFRDLHNDIDFSKHKIVIYDLVEKMEENLMLLYVKENNLKKAINLYFAILKISNIFRLSMLFIKTNLKNIKVK